MSPRRWWALTPPFHPYHRRLRRVSPLAVSFLCHFPSAFAAWDFPSVLPCGVRTFLERPREGARGHPACTAIVALAEMPGAAPAQQGRRLGHGSRRAPGSTRSGWPARAARHSTVRPPRQPARLPYSCFGSNSERRRRARASARSTAPTHAALQLDCRTPLRSVAPHSGQCRCAPFFITNSPQTRHSRLDARGASASSSCSSVRCEAQELGHRRVRKTPTTLPRTCTWRGVDRLERGVLGLQPDPAVLAVERLDGRLVGRLVVAGERDDDLAVPRVVLAAHDDDVAVEDPGLDHRVAADAQEEVGAARRAARARRLLLDVLLGEQRPAGGDLADERQARHASAASALGALAPAGRRARARAAWSGRAEQARPLEVREVRVHGGRRGEPDRLADLAHGRRVAVTRRRTRRGSPRSPVGVPVSTLVSFGRRTVRTVRTSTNVSVRLGEAVGSPPDDVKLREARGGSNGAPMSPGG